MLGSVSEHVATHASGPVVVCGHQNNLARQIVVGADGSDAAREALGCAFAAAVTRETTVLAVRAYTAATPPWGREIVPYVEDSEQRQADEHRRLISDLAPWADRYPDVKVEAMVVDGDPADALIRASTTAELVVVGSRGHGGFIGMLMGSVGVKVLHHAECPVMITHVTGGAPA